MSVNRSPRNHQLLSQISDSNPFKKTVPRAFDIADDYEKDRESIFGKDERGVELRRDLSPEGKRSEAQKAIRRAIRDLRDLKENALGEYHKQTEKMRAGVKAPSYDKIDIVGAMNRRELREASRAMTFGQRTAHLAGAGRDVDFIDAILEQPAWVSGIDVHNPNELQIYEEVKQSRLRDLHAPLLDSIAARETVESEALMIVNVVRGDIAADSGLESRDFEAIARPIETRAGAPWLVKNGDQVVRVRPEKRGTPELNQPATPDEIRDGKFYKSETEYLADRAAA